MTALPDGWKLRPLTDLAEVRLGRQRAPRNHSGVQMRPYLRAANVGWGGLRLDDVNAMNFTDAEMLTYRLEPGDILLSEASGSPHEVGKPALWDGEIKDCAFQNTLIRVRAHDAAPRFLLYFFKHLALSGQFVQQSRGVGIYHLSRARLASWPTPDPPLREQWRIVGILEDHLSRLDAAVHEISVSRQRLVRLREQLVMDALTGRALATPRHSSGPRGVGANDGVLPELPLGWTWSRLEDVADVVGGVTKDAKKQSDPRYVEVPYLRVANVQRGRLALDSVTTIKVAPDKAAALRLRPGDVLLNEGGDLNKLARGWVWEGQIETCIHQNHVFRARVRDQLVDPYFLSWTANTLGGGWAERNGNQSVNLASISLSMIRKMPVIIPPLGTSSQIVDRLHASLGSLNRLDAALDSAAHRSRSLRRVLLAAAFSGRLTGRSSDLDLAEETATEAVPVGLRCDTGLIDDRRGGTAHVH